MSDTTPAIPSRKIIIAYDESNIGRQVLEWVNSHSILIPTDQVIVALAINEDIAHVEGTPGWQAPLPGGIDAAREYRENIRELESTGRSRLAEAVQAIHSTGVKNVKAEILKGHANEQITRFAKEQYADMVICGNRGLGYWKRKLIGSTSEYLTHHLDCPVLVVKLHADK